MNRPLTDRYILFAPGGELYCDQDRYDQTYEGVLAQLRAADGWMLGSVIKLGVDGKWSDVSAELAEKIKDWLINDRHWGSDTYRKLQAWCEWHLDQAHAARFLEAAE